MCGRYVLRRIDWRRFSTLPFVDTSDEFSETRIVPRFNVAPSQLVPIVVDEAGAVRVRGATWGFVPHWAKGKGDAKLKPINAKAETVATSPMFRDAFDRRRCLVPADGFYEWKGAKAPKVPLLVRMKDDSVFMFAGLRSGDTMAILTTTPNELMAPIHNRMPVIVAPADYGRWLGEGGDVGDLLKPYDAGAMEAYPVSTLVNAPRNDVPQCVDRVEEEG